MSNNLILNFTTPPSNDDMQALAESLVDDLPIELDDLCDGLTIVVEDFPTQDIIEAFDLDTDFDLLALYRDAAEKMPGVALKGARPEKTLILYRRPVLDLWCETEDDLASLVRHLMITELAQQCGYGANDIERLANG